MFNKSIRSSHWFGFDAIDDSIQPDFNSITFLFKKFFKLHFFKVSQVKFRYYVHSNF